MTADWADLDGAADLAAERTELAIARSSSPNPRTRRYDLRGVGGEPAVLTVTRDQPGDQVEAVPVSIEITIGRFGDPQRERRFLDVFTRRLETLRGRDYAPIR